MAPTMVRNIVIEYSVLVDLSYPMSLPELLQNQGRNSVQLQMKAPHHGMPGQQPSTATTSGFQLPSARTPSPQQQTLGQV